ncbi:hypothetical protein G9F31_00935 [Acinetobacter sp. 187]|uniref:hypothetical protein n=1 Tax=Acinetobacter lanii TaxID=2715163 RepID=UPI00140BC6A1|nr:hypothetical protein [Acinetobacter lanii]NHC02349.1 hypothetical protein [Acinetobacter lanii]
MSIKQVWEIIQDYQCSELQMVQNPALAVWNHQQAIIDKRNKRIIELSAELEKAENKLRRLVK